MNKRLSDAYIRLRQKGAFPGRIDPWAEAGHYFHQIHSGMINHLQDLLQDELNARGYQAGKEASLQIFANRKPDLYIQDTQERPPTERNWDYVAVAQSLAVEAGIALLDEEDDLQALHITHMHTGELITVMEIISPRNKSNPQDRTVYRQQRQQLFLAQGVHVVEIDATRSIQRLLQHHLFAEYPYHIAIHLPDELPRVLFSQLEEPLKPFALPLRQEAIRTEPQSAYDHAYQRGAIAGLIAQNGHYMLNALPFASTLSDTQKATALQAVAQWQNELRLLESTNAD